jgi:ribonuclease HII
MSEPSTISNSNSIKNNNKNKIECCFSFEDNRIEIGVDEAGRGPMFGRVYTAAVILPKASLLDILNNNTIYTYSLMKDSKKFHSEKKIKEASEYIKKNALAWQVSYASEKVIDEINIRNATHRAMHEAIKGCIVSNNDKKDYHLLIDGNDFKPLIMMNNESVSLIQIQHTCIEGGDNKYASIAAASILAKVARDEYIADLCLSDPTLIAKYDLLKNKGYGTSKHLSGIKMNGITKYHRKSFGLCKEFA